MTLRSEISDLLIDSTYYGQYNNFTSSNTTVRDEIGMKTNFL